MIRPLYKPELIIFIQKTMNGYSSLYSKYSHEKKLKENEYIVFPQINYFLTFKNYEYIYLKTLFLKCVQNELLSKIPNNFHRL